MSRSFRRRLATGISCAESEAWWKSWQAGRLRAATRAALAAGREPPLPREVADVRGGPKDGKHWWGQRGLRLWWPTAPWKLTRK